MLQFIIQMPYVSLANCWTKAQWIDFPCRCTHMLMHAWALKVLAQKISHALQR